MFIEADRLVITDFTEDMAEIVHLNSLDEANRRFVPDEVFETVEDARETLEFLIGQYGTDEGPYVHPIILKTGENIGYVQLVPIEDGWEVGYHVAEQYRGMGYASEAVCAFLPAAAEKKKLSEIWGICLAENAASEKVMEKSGFECVFRGVGPYQGEDREIVKYVWKAER
ncbi:MAG: GNAT family N-acetyltransferase [Lachnospiraceae bacterium]|nr:GNAT family N-acetyltransferase [Lachnospiraceae bacterium]